MASSRGSPLSRTGILHVGPNHTLGVHRGKRIAASVRKERCHDRRRVTVAVQSALRDGGDCRRLLLTESAARANHSVAEHRLRCCRRQIGHRGKVQREVPLLQALKRFISSWKYALEDVTSILPPMVLLKAAHCLGLGQHSSPGKHRQTACDPP